MDGEVEACSGGVFASCGVAITLLVNYLDGNVIKDSEGKAPYFDSLELFTAVSYTHLNGAGRATDWWPSAWQGGKAAPRYLSGSDGKDE